MKKGRGIEKGKLWRREEKYAELKRTSQNKKEWTLFVCIYSSYFELIR